MNNTDRYLPKEPPTFVVHNPGPPLWAWAIAAALAGFLIVWAYITILGGI